MKSPACDAAGEAVASIDALGLRSSTIYDLADRTFASINPLGQRITTLYNAASESIAAIDPLTRRHSTVYDLAGRTLASINPRHERSSTVNDAAGESIASISALGCRVSSSYDLAGRRIRLTDPNSHATTFLYDNAGQQVGQIDPLLRRVSYAYDLAGQRTLVLDARGLRITSVYDAAGQRTAELLPNTQRTSYGYDLAGRRILLNDSFGRTSTIYDAKGRTVVVAQPGGKSVTYAYDAADRRVYVADPDGGRTSYSHDAAGRLLAVNAPGAGPTTMAYDAANRLIARWPAGSARVSQVYDAAGQQTLIAATSSNGTPVNRFSYTYDWAGRRTQVFYLDGSRATYMYDPAGQLIREQRNGTLAANATFTYDAAGNRSLLLDSGQPTTSTYDAANQHLVDVAPTGRTTYLYDLAGNRTQLETAAASTYYDWDVYNRLTQAEPVSGPVSMAYDGDGRRVQRQTPTETRRFVYDFEKVLQDTDGDGLTQKQYASTEEQYGDLLSAYGDGQARYFAADALGSTDALLAPDGSVPDKWAYRAFGLESHTQGTDDNRYTWVGRQGYYEDREIGLYFPGARPYDPLTARFLSSDPDSFAAGDANLYRYAGNDPVNLTDPSGRRILVPECQWKGSQTWRFAQDNFWAHSTASDALSGEIYSQFGVRPPGVSDGRLLLHGPVDVKGVNYGVVDLFDELPAIFWSKLSESNSYLAAPRIGRGLKEDVVITSDLHGPQTWLKWSEPKASFWYTVSGTLDSIKNAIANAGADVSTFLKEGLNQATTQVVLTGLTAILKQAQERYPKLNPDRVIDLINRMGRIADVAAKAVSNPAKLGETLGQGVKQGFKQFLALDNLFATLIRSFLDWLLKPLQKKQPRVQFPELPANVNYSTSAGLLPLAGYALGVLGLTPEALLEKVRVKATSKLGPRAIGVLRVSYELLGAAAEGGLASVANVLGSKASAAVGGGAVGDDVKKIITDVAGGQLPSIDLSTFKDKAFEAGWMAAEPVIIRKLTQKAFELLASLADWTGITGVVKGAYQVYQSVEFLLDEADKLVKFFETLAGGVQDLLDEKIGPLAKTVQNGLNMVVGFLLRYLLDRVLGLQDLPNQVSKAIETVQGWLNDPLDLVLDWLLDKGAALLGLGGADKSARLTGEVTSKDGRVTVWLEDVGGRVVVMVRASDPRPLSKALDEVVASSGEKQHELAQERSRETKAESAGAQLKARLSQPPKSLDKAVNKEVSSDAAKAEMPLQALADGASKLLGGSCGLPMKMAGKCFIGRMRPGVPGSEKDLGSFPAGRRVWGRDKQSSWGWRRGDEPKLRLLRLRLVKDAENWVDVTLLRRASWLHARGVVAGGLLYLDMAEMGSVGWAQVLGVEACPMLEDGPGCLVTGTFRHNRGVVYDLWVSGERESIGVTAGHPFWSVDRQAWVPVESLWRGERLLALDGSTPLVESFTLHAGEEPVYNLEVDGDHCYRVGQQGLLVHNVSVFVSIDPKQYAEIFSTGVECYCNGTTKTIPKRAIPEPDPNGWVKPAGIKIDLPTDKKIGEWQGTPGDSDFVVYEQYAASVGLTASDRTVPYRRGEPYFDKWAVEWYEIPGLAGTGDDFNLVGLAVALRHGICGAKGVATATAGKQYLATHKPQLTPHHAYECYVAIIPTALNSGLSHTGTAAVLRTGSAKC